MWRLRWHNNRQSFHAEKYSEHIMHACKGSHNLRDKAQYYKLVRTLVSALVALFLLQQGFLPNKQAICKDCFQCLCVCICSPGAQYVVHAYIIHVYVYTLQIHLYTMAYSQTCSSKQLLHHWFPCVDILQ